MTNTELLRLLTIGLTLLAIYILVKGKNSWVMTPVIVWLAHVAIFNVAVFLLPNTMEINLWLNMWSCGIRIQAISTIIAVTLYLRHLSADTIVAISSIANTESKSANGSGAQWLTDTMELVLSRMPQDTLADAAGGGGDGN